MKTLKKADKEKIVELIANNVYITQLETDEELLIKKSELDEKAKVVAAKERILATLNSTLGDFMLQERPKILVYEQELIKMKKAAGVADAVLVDLLTRTAGEFTTSGNPSDDFEKTVERFLGQMTTIMDYRDAVLDERKKCLTLLSGVDQMAEDRGGGAFADAGRVNYDVDLESELKEALKRQGWLERQANANVELVKGMEEISVQINNMEEKLAGYNATLASVEAEKDELDKQIVVLKKELQGLTSDGGGARSEVKTTIGGGGGVGVHSTETKSAAAKNQSTLAAGTMRQTVSSADRPTRSGSVKKTVDE